MIVHQITTKEAKANPFAPDIYLIKIDLTKATMYYYPIKRLSGETIQKESKQVNTIFCRIDWKGDQNEETGVTLANKHLGPWECPGQLSINMDIPR